jgi:glutaconate CoA-transferase subunit A
MIASTADSLITDLRDGATIALMKDSSGAPMALARAIIRKGVRALHLLCVPTGGWVADLLIGAGCVATVQGGGVSLGEYGSAPNFVRAIRSGAVRPLDTTCPAVYSALQAAEKGIPFMPIRGLIGSDILRYRPDYLTTENPFAPGEPLVLVPAIRPDLALIHAPLADAEGNVWVWRQHELRTLAHAALRTVATVEAFHPASLPADPRYDAALIPALYIAGVAPAPGGARPLAMAGHYGEDRAALAGYLAAAQSEAGFATWLRRFVDLDASATAA